MEVFVADVNDVRSGTRHLIKAGSRNVAVYNHKGHFYAMDNACYHHGGPLLNGDIEELGGHPCVICPWHSYRIALDTGEGLYWGLDMTSGKPVQQLKSKGCKQRTHKTYVRDGKLYCFVDASGPGIESDGYANMAMANRDQPTKTEGGAIPIHSGLRSGHVYGNLPNKTASDSPLLTVRCVKVIPHTADTSSFVFAKDKGSTNHRLMNGQWVLLVIPTTSGGEGEEELERQWTVTATNRDGGWFTITVKLRPGATSGGSWWLHKSGRVLETPLVVRNMGGTFSLQHERSRVNTLGGNVLMISAGIGITPMLGSLRHYLNDLFTLSSGPPLYIHHFHVDRSRSSIPCLSELEAWHQSLSNKSPLTSPVRYALTLFLTAAEGEEEGETKERKGRRPTVADWMPLLEATGPNVLVMLCGPVDFMEDTARKLEELGVAATHIVREEF